ncbi:MAG TPA: acyl-CoA thioester hydrolase/BAAT C-terminal domain-containing protein [Candidatus Saccharimonadales bacterium]|nr:acyl-CoA thioester hydrolase/BAAT C-terminal domain-containing protein [Candidatus Saccharimonadales bacterium]
MNSSISKHEINTHGLIGELFVPQGEGPFPAVMCIGGSSGGAKTAAAPLLAEAGFVAFSLGYFGAPGLPEEFAELPLETFEHGVDWLLQQPMVQGPKVGVTGTSRGSEAALQVAALTSKVGAVAAYVPSGIRWMGVEGRPSWTYHGKPLPYVQWQNDFEEDGAVAKADRFNHVLDDPSAYAAAEIELEKAACPILLISGKDDQLWPSERMANLIMERLKKHNYPYHYEHIAYPNAGHRIKVPGLGRESYEPVSEDTVTHEMLSLGGTYEGNKAASEQSWDKMIGFFQAAQG